MSTIYDGKVIESSLSANSMGGTEMMRARLLKHVDSSLFDGLAIHLSRPQKMHPRKNIFYAHDLPDQDSVTNILKFPFDHYVFVSNWQRDQFAPHIPNFDFDKITVIQNAIEKPDEHIKPKDRVNIIYHTTPHRGLDIAFEVFKRIRKTRPDVYFDAYSSFDLYGWKDADATFKKLFEEINRTPGAKSHGSVPNEEIREKLKTSHIFLYPSVWLETSCISMIEANAHGLYTVHPNFGALSETGSSMSYSVPYDPRNDRVGAAYDATMNLLEKSNFDTKNELNEIHSIEHFSKKWTDLLKGMCTHG